MEKTKSEPAPLWCATRGKAGSLPKPRLPVKNKTGQPLYIAERIKKGSKQPKPKLKEMYDKLTVKTKWLKGGGEAKADLERYMQSYHCGEKNEEDDEDDRAEPVSFASVREAGTQLINADNAKRSKLKAKGKAQVQPPAATPKLVAPGGELQVYEGAAPEATPAAAAAAVLLPPMLPAMLPKTALPDLQGATDKENSHINVPLSANSQIF